MAKIFISYSSKDAKFVDNLATTLQSLGHSVWLDKWEIRVGDSIVTKLESGIEKADYVAVVLSANSTKSNWVEQEWHAKYWDEVAKRRIMVLPLLIEDCSIPQLLKPKKYADFRKSFEVGLVELTLSLQPRQEISGIDRYYGDFVDIPPADWIDFFAHSKSLDIIAMYSATWRNTFLKYIRKMLEQKESRLRVVLPEAERDNSLIGVYAKHIGISEISMRERVLTAYEEFGELENSGNVQVFATTTRLTHAFYLFDSGGVLSLYSYNPKRAPSPALALREGELLHFLRKDFEYLVSDPECSRRITGKSNG